MACLPRSRCTRPEDLSRGISDNSIASQVNWTLFWMNMGRWDIRGQLRRLNATSLTSLRNGGSGRSENRSGQAKGAGWRPCSGPPSYPAIGTSSSDSRWKARDRLRDILAMNPGPWQRRHCRSSNDEAQNAECNQAPRHKRTTRHGSGGDANGDIGPDRATQHSHRSVPAITTMERPLQERQMERLPPLRPQPVS